MATHLSNSEAGTTGSMDPSSITSWPYFASEDYVKKMPSPPRILVPPPTAADLKSLRSSKAPYLNSNYGFIAGLDLSALWSNVDPLQWSYEKRRTAQSVLPFLYLGPTQAAKQSDFLEKEHITMVLAVRHSQTLENRASRIAQSLGLETATVDIVEPQGVIAALSSATQIINHHLSNRTNPNGSSTGRVLVYCESGNERSAIVVVGYLMDMLNIGLVQAIQLVQARRFCAYIDDTMKETLLAYEGILQAKRDASYTQPSYRAASLSGSSSQKRSMVDTDSAGDIGDASDCNDNARFANRAFAPFVD